MLPGLVEFIVHPANHVRRAVDQIDIRVRVKAAKKVVGEIQNVLVAYLSRYPCDTECLLKGLRSASVPVATVADKIRALLNIKDLLAKPLIPNWDLPAHLQSGEGENL